MRVPRVFTSALLALLLSGASSIAADRPNIVFILTDDQAPTALGVSGHNQYRTPHLDRLFQEGAYLVNAFVTTPVCSPSRASLMASRYGTELGILDWINPQLEPEEGLDPQVVTWPEVLQQAGYQTGLCGKWHLGTADRFHPTRTGFDYFMGFRGGGTTPKDPLLEEGGVERKLEGFTADLITDRAIDFLKTHAAGPFLLSLHFREPHAPWVPVPEEDAQPFAAIDPEIPDSDYPQLDVAEVKRKMRQYLASVSCVDRNVGRVLATLDELGLRDDTIVVFTSDHGYNTGHNGVWHKGNAHWQLTELPPQQWPDIPPRMRPNLYDQSLRAPTAIRWPGVIKPATRIEQTVTHLDWYPTLLAAAGVPLPAGETVRGRSILPLLRGETVEWDNDHYCEYSLRHGATCDMRGLRTPRWKLMVDFHNAGREELYDLANDPTEKVNLAASSDPQHVAIKAELRQRIVAKMRAIGDPIVDLSQEPQ